MLENLPVPQEILLPAVLLLASLGVAYRKKNSLSLYSITPRQWHLFKGVIQGVRKSYFSKDIDVRHVETDASLEEIELAFLKANCAEWDILSYHYKGEKLNFRKVDYDETFEYPRVQDHFRVFEEDGVRTLAVHREVRPIMRPFVHLSNKTIRVDPAMDTLAGIFADANLTYRPL